MSDPLEMYRPRPIVRASARLWALLLAALLPLAAGPVPAENRLGTVSRDDELRERPFPIAPVVTAVSAGTEVEVLERQGYWLRVKRREAEGEGWIRLIRIRYRSDATPAQASNSGGGSLFSSLARGATGLLGGGGSSAPRETTTIGIRGLSSEDLRAANPDPRAFESLKRSQAEPRAARAFAAAGGLRTQGVPDPD